MPLGAVWSEPMLRGVNHVTLVVSDLETSLPFYRDLLGCKLRARWARGAYLSAGGTWLCLELGEATSTTSARSDTHIAFDVAPEDFDALRVRLVAQAELWKSNTSESDSVYFLDPDGHKLEVHVGSLESRLASALGNYDGIVLMD